MRRTPEARALQGNITLSKSLETLASLGLCLDLRSNLCRCAAGLRINSGPHLRLDPASFLSHRYTPNCRPLSEREAMMFQFTLSIGKMVTNVPGLGAVVGNPEGQTIRARVEPLNSFALRRFSHLRDAWFGHKFGVSSGNNGSPNSL